MNNCNVFRLLLLLLAVLSTFHLSCDVCYAASFVVNGVPKQLLLLQVQKEQRYQKQQHHQHHQQQRLNNILHSSLVSSESSITKDNKNVINKQEQNKEDDEGNGMSLLPYNWKEQWYAVTFASYVLNPSQTAEVIPVSIFGQPLVLWRSVDNGPIHCANDICPHRSAALSEGRIRNGKLECYYHGWQFDANPSTTSAVDTSTGTSPNNVIDTRPGSCTFIPQLARGATIPKSACLQMRPCRVVEGIVWVWMGDDDNNIKPVPAQNDLLDPITGQRPGYILNDFQIDLPYDHSYLVENLLDPAHIDISHDSTSGGGKRERAEAYSMIVDPDSFTSNGFTGRYCKESQKFNTNNNNNPYIEVQYEAPGIIRQKASFMFGNTNNKSKMNNNKDTTTSTGTNSTNTSTVFGAALHCMPLGFGRSRLLFRSYFGGDQIPLILMLMLRVKPKFLYNLNSCKVLEQDVGLITTQEDHFTRNPQRQIKNDFLLLQSSDVFVKSYRQWLDQVGHGMPWYQGLLTRSTTTTTTTNTQASNGHGQPTIIPTTTTILQPNLDVMNHRAGNVLETRYHRHVIHCPTTRNALLRVQQLKRIMVSIAILSITILSSINTYPKLISSFSYHLRTVLVPIIPLSCLAGAILHKLEQCFFVSFKRKEQMRTEKGI